MIKKTGSGYVVMSENGKKRLSRVYSTKEAAEKRLAQIERFKRRRDGNKS